MCQTLTAIKSCVRRFGAKVLLLVPKNHQPGFISAKSCPINSQNAKEAKTITSANKFKPWFAGWRSPTMIKSILNIHHNNEPTMNPQWTHNEPTMNPQWTHDTYAFYHGFYHGFYSIHSAFTRCRAPGSVPLGSQIPRAAPVQDPAAQPAPAHALPAARAPGAGRGAVPLGMAFRTWKCRGSGSGPPWWNDVKRFKEQDNHGVYWCLPWNYMKLVSFLEVFPSWRRDVQGILRMDVHIVDDFVGGAGYHSQNDLRASATCNGSMGQTDNLETLMCPKILSDHVLQIWVSDTSKPETGSISGSSLWSCRCVSPRPPMGCPSCRLPGSTGLELTGGRGGAAGAGGCPQLSAHCCLAWTTTSTSGRVVGHCGTEPNGANGANGAEGAKGNMGWTSEGAASPQWDQSMAARSLNATSMHFQNSEKSL